ncbi:MAG: phage tail sheath C-terminal domain-containing protein [Pseudomonadota bacterium]
MADYKTPGVYVVEDDAFSNSVVQVATAVPAFIGCTEKALRGAESLAGIPTRISSLSEYHALFGGPAPLELNFKAGGDDHAPPYKIDVLPCKRFFFYNSLRIFFDNGGGLCYIVSVGAFRPCLDSGGMPAMTLAALVDRPLDALLKQSEPTMIVVPDLVLLSNEDWAGGIAAIIGHCVTLQSRIGIFDVRNGDVERDDRGDVIENFRAKVGAAGDQLNYGVAYYPWLNTNIVDAGDMHVGLLDKDSRGALFKYLKDEVVKQFPDENGEVSVKAAALNHQLDQMLGVDPATADGMASIRSAHALLKTKLTVYEAVLAAMLKAANLLPPSGAMAGVYTRTDNNEGVFKAPANTPIFSALSPTVEISHDAQEELNVPLDGKAINAIRSLPGRGMLVWGARTLDGNSQDWRFINVRRTTIMLEQSIKWALQTYRFAANNAQTWAAVNSMIVNFLTQQWKEGALQGASAPQAFSVDVGLGSTMDGDDILGGTMRVMVKVALVHPAEFIVLTFVQHMATA